MNDVHEVRVAPVEPRLVGDVQPVEGVGHVTGEQGARGVQAGDPGQPRALISQQLEYRPLIG